MEDQKNQPQPDIKSSMSMGQWLRSYGALFIFGLIIVLVRIFHKSLNSYDPDLANLLITLMGIYVVWYSLAKKWQLMHNLKILMILTTIISILLLVGILVFYMTQPNQ
ncbi:MAG: hypothetical protein V1853_04005 [bacterium]